MCGHLLPISLKNEAKLYCLVIKLWVFGHIMTNPEPRVFTTMAECPGVYVISSALLIVQILKK